MANKSQENVEAAGEKSILANERKVTEDKSINNASVNVVYTLCTVLSIYIMLFSDWLQPGSWCDMGYGTIPVQQVILGNEIFTFFFRQIRYCLPKQSKSSMGCTCSALEKTPVPQTPKPKSGDEALKLPSQMKSAGREEEMQGLKRMRIAYEYFLYDKGEQVKITVDAFLAVDNAVEESELVEAEQKLETENEKFWTLINNCQWFERSLKLHEERMIRRFGKLDLYEEFIKKKV
jgi:hypothetical protein